MSTESVMNELSLARKVIAFANLGVLASDSFLKRAKSAVVELASVGRDMSQSIQAVSAMESRILPSQALCQEGMREIDAHLLPMRQQIRDQGASQVLRPRPA